jgi:C-terminal processing protease CtpA/Prc
MLVKQVISETGARRAGLYEEDIITRINSSRIRNVNDVVLALYDLKPGAKIKVDYLRAGKRQSCDVVLTSRESAGPGVDVRLVPQQQPQHYPHWGFERGGMMMPMMGVEFGGRMMFDR